MTDVLFINPFGAHGIYGPLGASLVAVEPPMWLRVNAGYIRGLGKSVAVIDAERDRLSAAEVAKRVEEVNPRLVAILAYGHNPSASTQAMYGAGAVATAIKALNPRRCVAIAGGHVSALPERTLAEESVDYVVVGEGPYGFEELLATLPNDSAVIRSGPFDIRDNTDQAWDLTPPAGYTAHNWHAFGDGANRSPYASVWTTLNCPYSCQFCCISAPFGGPGYKVRDPSAVVDEIEVLVRDHGVKYLKVIDEMFVLKPSHYLPIAQGLIERGIAADLNIWAYARVDTVRPDTLDLLRRGGFRWLALGIESGSSSVRDGANKRLKTDDIVEVVRTVQHADINVVGNFMFGLRDDTVETMRQTLALALDCLPEWANFYCTMAYPGSRLYDQALTEGWTLPSSWAGYSQHNFECRPLDTEHVDAETVLRFRDAAFHTFFSDPAYQRMISRKFGAPAVSEVEKMLSYKLDRRLLG